LQASLLRRATVARRDTFLQAAANFLRDPQIWTEVNQEEFDKLAQMKVNRGTLLK
jgi:hypothetical protein